MKKEDYLGYWKNLLVIDPQEDCHCDIETYDSDDDGGKKIVWLREGEPETVSYAPRIRLPMSLNPITKEQFQQCVLTALPFAKQVTLNDVSRFENIIINKNTFDKLPEESKTIIDNWYRYNHRFLLPEISEDHIYFAPPPEELGVFTWNLSRHGMFIIADRLGFLVI